MRNVRINAVDGMVTLAPNVDFRVPPCVVCGSPLHVNNAGRSVQAEHVSNHYHCEFCGDAWAEVYETNDD